MKLLFLLVLFFVSTCYAQKDSINPIPTWSPFEYKYPKEIDEQQQTIILPDSLKDDSISGYVCISYGYSSITCEIGKVKINKLFLSNTNKDTICYYSCFKDTCTYISCVERYQAFFEDCVRRIKISTKSTNMEWRKMYGMSGFRLWINPKKD